MRSDSPPNSNTAMIGTAKRPTVSAIQTPTAVGSSRLRAPGSSDGVRACNPRQLLANAVGLGHVESGHLPRTSRGRVDNQPCQVEQAIERSLPCLDELDPIEGDQRGDLEQRPARDQHVARPDLVSPSPIPEVRDQHRAEHDDPGDHTRDRRRDLALARIQTQDDRDDERDSARDRPPQQKDTSIKPACRALHASDANARDARSQRTCIRTPALSSSWRRQGAWWAPRSSKPVCGRELAGGFDSRPPPRRERYKNPGYEVVGPDVVTALHDDLVGHAGQQLLELLNGPRLGGPEESRPEIVRPCSRQTRRLASRPAELLHDAADSG